MPEMPEWFQVWWWLRYRREPRVTTPLPQQSGGRAEDAMTLEEYEQLAAEWVAAGRPSTSTLSALYESVPF